METKKVYQFDDKKIYKRTLTLDASDKSASGAWNIPSDCVETEPPAPQENTAYKWQGGEWVAVEDYRKKEYWLPGDTYGTPGREVKEIGPLPEGATLTPPEQTLEDVKTAKVAEMKAERDRREQLPIEYNGASYDYDLKSAFKLDKARTRIRVRQLDNQPWIDAESGIQALTETDIDQIDALAADRSNNLHMQYAALKVYIEGLTDKEAVEAVTFDTEIDISAQINQL